MLALHIFRMLTSKLYSPFFYNLLHFSFIVTEYISHWSCRDAVNTLITVTDTTIASGDDQGCVKVCTVIFSLVFDHY